MTSALKTGMDELVENFELLGDWESRFAYLIDLGKQLPPLAEEDMCEDNRVHGCQAQVWMKFVPRPGNGAVDIVADSDAFIVKGLIAVLLLIYSGKSAEEILNTDGSAVLAKLQLAVHLSPTRKSGRFHMVQRIRKLAEGEAENL